MKLNIEINCDNSAFEESPIEEIKRILNKYSHRVNEIIDGGTIYLMDFNGRKIGEMTVTLPPKAISLSLRCPNCDSKIKTKKIEGTTFKIVCKTCFEKINI